MRGRVVTNNDHSQMGMDALFGQMSDAGLEVGLNLGQRRFGRPGVVLPQLIQDDGRFERSRAGLTGAS